MSLNWKLRLKNKATLITLATVIITAVYGVLAAFGVTPSITQDQIMNFVITILSLLAGLGIVVDPTTAGIGDSERALGYDEPSKGNE